MRLYDVTMGFKNINNPCDLVVYRNGTLNLIECKAVHGNTLNFKSHIRENQWNKLLDYSKVHGVNAGIIVWFIDKDKTYFLDIYLLNEMKRYGRKSYNVITDGDNLFNMLAPIPIHGKKKKVFFEYDLDDFLKEVQ